MPKKKRAKMFFWSEATPQERAKTLKQRGTQRTARITLQEKCCVNDDEITDGQEYLVDLNNNIWKGHVKCVEAALKRKKAEPVETAQEEETYTFKELASEEEEEPVEDLQDAIQRALNEAYHRGLNEGKAEGFKQAKQVALNLVNKVKQKAK